VPASGWTTDDAGVGSTIVREERVWTLKTSRIIPLRAIRGVITRKSMGA
jgi:hypothetical protein